MIWLDRFLWSISFLQYIPYFYLVFAAIVIVPACFKTEFGIRRMYIKILMKLFDWATCRIEKSNRGTRPSTAADEIISKENSIDKISSLSNMLDAQDSLKLDDICFLIKSGIEAILDDEVTKRFCAEELPSWNLLTRSNYPYHFISVRLSILWVLGLILRYCILFPLRVCTTATAMAWIVLSSFPLMIIPESRFKRKLAYFCNIVIFRLCCRAFCAVVNYHDRENMPVSGICVANHTTTLDAAILMQDRPYAILGQIHGGFLGWLELSLSNFTKHVWFERTEVRDRQYVVRRVKEHTDDPNNYPILLFPEGTCINNTSVMMFKKGIFEIPATIYPVAIKYNPWFGDAFWNSSKHSMVQYLAVVMTSWAIVADVWYLPPMRQQQDEDAFQFADRVKSVIAHRGGLVDCVWDGQLKRMRVKDSYKRDKQKEISEMIMRRANPDDRE